MRFRNQFLDLAQRQSRSMIGQIGVGYLVPDLGAGQSFPETIESANVHRVAEILLPARYCLANVGPVRVVENYQGTDFREVEQLVEHAFAAAEGLRWAIDDD